MPTAYLHKVLIYLQQELPENYREQLSLTGEKLVITIPDTADFSRFMALYIPSLSAVSPGSEAGITTLNLPSGQPGRNVILNF